MINELDVVVILQEELPEAAAALESAEASQNMYKTLEIFSMLTQGFIQSCDFTKVRQCFSIAENLLKYGNPVVKHAIENVYIFAVGTFAEQQSINNKRWNDIFQGSLREEYYRQISISGI